jgi:hypothetical protein
MMAGEATDNRKRLDLVAWHELPVGPLAVDPEGRRAQALFLMELDEIRRTLYLLLEQDTERAAREAREHTAKRREAGRRAEPHRDSIT